MPMFSLFRRLISITPSSKSGRRENQRKDLMKRHIVQLSLRSLFQYEQIISSANGHGQQELLLLPAPTPYSKLNTNPT